MRQHNIWCVYVRSVWRGVLDCTFPQTAQAHTHYRVSQEECAIFREGVPYVKLYRYNPKHLYPKLNGYGDNGKRKVWTSCISAFYTPTAVSQTTPPSGHMTACGTYVGQFYCARAPPIAIRQYFIAARYASAWNPKDNRWYQCESFCSSI